MKIRKELIKREIAGETILIPVGKTVYETNGMFALNELGTFIWDRLEQTENQEELVRAVMEEYEVDEETVRQDVEEFLGKLSALGVI